MNFEEKQLEAIKMDVRRLVRLNGINGLPEKIADYVIENCQPRSEPVQISGEIEESKALVINRVMSIISEHFGVSINKIISDSKKREFVYPRQVGMYLLSIKTHFPIRVIGEVFGGRHYSTVIHSRDIILDKMNQERFIKEEIKYLLKKV